MIILPANPDVVPNRRNRGRKEAGCSASSSGYPSDGSDRFGSRTVCFAAAEPAEYFGIPGREITSEGDLVRKLLKHGEGIRSER